MTEAQTDQAPDGELPKQPGLPQYPPSHVPGEVGATDAPRLVQHGKDRVSPDFLDSATVDYFITADGERLRTAYWSPHNWAPQDSQSTTLRGTVMVLSGFSEFIEKYYETARDLTAMGFAVLCFDWRGQGLSTRAQKERRGWVPNYEVMMSDTLELVRYCESLKTPGPLIALGHSMGGNVCLRLLQSQQAPFAAAAVTAPMLGIKGISTWLLRSITHTGSRVGMDEKYAPGAKDNDPFGPHIALSNDPERIQNWRNYLQHDPYLITHGATWRWAREAATSMYVVNQPANIAAITTPLFIANAMQDSLVDPIPTQKFSELCSTAETLELPDSQHEVLQEIDSIRGLFFEHFDRFIRKHLESS